MNADRQQDHNSPTGDAPSSVSETQDSGQSSRLSSAVTHPAFLITSEVLIVTALAAMYWHPVSSTFLRGLWLGLMATGAAIAIALVRRRRWLALSVSGLALLPLIILILPGRPVDPDRLVAEYLRQLKRYEGVPYVWGGESRRGIDCSGLVRRGLINAYVHVGFGDANPAALRAALDLWWHDCTAKALGEGYRELTTPIARVDAIRNTDVPLLCPGDMAVTASGKHVLAYLGDGEWIQADPGLGGVLTLPASPGVQWFNQPVRIVRWTTLESRSDGE